MRMKKNKAIKVNIDKNVFSPIYIKENILFDDTELLLLFGGAGSGKSHFAAQKIIYRLLTEQNHKILSVRKVYSTIKDSVYTLFTQIINDWNLNELFTFKLSPLEIECINGNKIIFKGLDDAEKIKSISGITSIWIEEASELKNSSELNQLMARVRGKHLKNYVQFILTFNPISEHHWLKKEFFDVPRENVKILKTTYLDNPFLDEAYIKRLESYKDIDETFYNIYALGNWGVLGNIIFSNWKVEEFDKEKIEEKAINGADFGFNDPNALIRIVYKDDTIYILDEIYLKHSTTGDFIKEINKKIPEHELIICDNAYPGSILEMKRAGLKAVGAKKGKNSVKTGIDFIKQQKIIIHPSCIHFIKEIQSYKYREDKEGNVFDEPVDINNHLLDALRYAMEQFNKGQNGVKIKAGNFKFY